MVIVSWVPTLCQGLPLVITKKEVFSSPLTDGTQRLKEAKGLGQQTCLRSSDSDGQSWDWHSGKEKDLPAQAGDIRDAGSIPGLERSPGEGMATHSSILA